MAGGLGREYLKKEAQDAEQISAEGSQNAPKIPDSSDKPKYHDAVMGFSQLALGFSIVIAIALGVGIGLLLRKWLGYEWLLWLGVFWGVGGAILNVYKAYKTQFTELEKLKEQPRYRYKKDKEA